MRRDAGFVLLNALLVVIAISAIATALLGLSARSTARLSDIQADAQLSLYLDGAEALIVTFLEQEWDEDGTDDLAEPWASNTLEVPIDRGRIGADLTDLQGRLNLNLAGHDGPPRADLDRLFTTLGLPLPLLEAIADYLSDSGPADITPYLRRAVPVLPQGGPARLSDDLRLVEGMTQAAFARLSRFATVLPPDTPLNVNTAPAEVLRAVLPNLSADQIAAILRDRERSPFETSLAFRNRIAEILGEDALADLLPDRFTTRTAWFEAVARAELDGQVRQRRLIVYRDDADGTTRVLFALPVPQALPVPE